MSRIQIVRKWQSDTATISELNSNGGALKGYVLERPGPDTAQSGQRLRIPEGTYRLKWHNSNIPTVKPYNPVPLLYNSTVSEGRYILIHNGNYPSNTDGCLLVGETKGSNVVNSSVSMLRKVKDYLNDAGIDNVFLEISSDYE